MHLDLDMAEKAVWHSSAQGSIRVTLEDKIESLLKV